MSDEAVLTVGISHAEGRWWVTTGGGHAEFEDARAVCAAFIKLARAVHADEKEWDTFDYFACDGTDLDNFEVGDTIRWYTKMLADPALCAKRRSSFTVALRLVQERHGRG